MFNLRMSCCKRFDIILLGFHARRQNASLSHLNPPAVGAFSDFPASHLTPSVNSDTLRDLLFRGRSWSLSVFTEIVDHRCKFHMGRLERSRELARRRVRAVKLKKLRALHAAATNDADRKVIAEKVARISPFAVLEQPAS